jgi:hypothetical protein
MLGLGYGGTAVAQFATRADVSAEIGTYEKMDTGRHAELRNNVDGNTVSIGKITGVVEEVQETQHRDIARSEARRITSDVRDRAQRETLYDTLLGINLKRLKRGQDPCSNVDCK